MSHSHVNTSVPCSPRMYGAYVHNDQPKGLGPNLTGASAPQVSEACQLQVMPYTCYRLCHLEQMKSTERTGTKPTEGALTEHAGVFGTPCSSHICSAAGHLHGVLALFQFLPCVRSATGYAVPMRVDCVTASKCKPIQRRRRWSCARARCACSASKS